MYRIPSLLPRYIQLIFLNSLFALVLSLVSHQLQVQRRVYQKIALTQAIIEKWKTLEINYEFSNKSPTMLDARQLKYLNGQIKRALFTQTKFKMILFGYEIR